MQMCMRSPEKRLRRRGFAYYGGVCPLALLPPLKRSPTSTFVSGCRLRTFQRQIGAGPVGEVAGYPHVSCLRKAVSKDSARLLYGLSTLSLTDFRTKIYSPGLMPRVRKLYGCPATQGLFVAVAVTREHLRHFELSRQVWFGDGLAL